MTRYYLSIIIKAEQNCLHYTRCITSFSSRSQHHPQFVYNPVPVAVRSAWFLLLCIFHLFNYVFLPSQPSAFMNPVPLTNAASWFIFIFPVPIPLLPKQHVAQKLCRCTFLYFLQLYKHVKCYVNGTTTQLFKPFRYILQASVEMAPVHMHRLSAQALSSIFKTLVFIFPVLNATAAPELTLFSIQSFIQMCLRVHQRQ